MKRESVFQTWQALERYITLCFSLDIHKKELSAQVINANLIQACAYNTYIETLSNKADTIFRYIKESDTAGFTFSYLAFIEQVAKKIHLKDKSVMLAIDYTKESFWGNVQGVDIFGVKKTDKGSGAFKFLTVSQVSSKIHAKIPLISIPVKMGHNKSHAISHCISLLSKCIGNIDVILFDREFYIKELLMTLNHQDLPYLIFVPKKKGEISDTLLDMIPGETLTKVHTFDVNIHKTVLHDQTTMMFLKAIFDGKTYEHYDWCFVTNLTDFDIEKPEFQAFFIPLQLQKLFIDGFDDIFLFLR